MHQGIPHGGALVPIGLARANARVCNGRDEAAIELVGTLRLRALAPVRIASDEALARDLEPLEEWTIECGAARVRYVALRGGLDVPYVLGGSGYVALRIIRRPRGAAVEKGGYIAGWLRRGATIPAPASPGSQRANPRCGRARRRAFQPKRSGCAVVCDVSYLPTRGSNGDTTSGPGASSVGRRSGWFCPYDARGDSGACLRRRYCSRSGPSDRGRVSRHRRRGDRRCGRPHGPTARHRGAVHRGGTSGVMPPKRMVRHALTSAKRRRP
jgi:hypothetical protein